MEFSDYLGIARRGLHGAVMAQNAPYGSIAARSNPLRYGSVFSRDNPGIASAIDDQLNGGMSRRNSYSGSDPDTQAYRDQSYAELDHVSAPSQASIDYAREKGYDPNTGAYSAPQVYNGTQFVNSPQSMQAQLSEFDRLKQQQQR